MLSLSRDLDQVFGPRAIASLSVLPLFDMSRALVPAQAESDVDLLEADAEPTPSKKTSWWPLGLSLAIAAAGLAGLFVVVGIVAFKTHRHDALQVPTEGEGHFINFGSKDISVGAEGVSMSVDAFKHIATSFTDGFKNEGAVTDFSKFAKDTVVSAKAFMKSKGIVVNAFAGFCDSFRCFGCDEGGVHKTTIRVKDGSNWFSNSFGGVHEFCLVMGPESSEFTIQRLNDEDNWYSAGRMMTNSIGPKSLSFGDSPEIVHGYSKLVQGSMYLKLKKKYGEEKAKKIFAAAKAKALVSVYHKLKVKYGEEKAKKMIHRYLHKS